MRRIGSIALSIAILASLAGTARADFNEDFTFVNLSMNFGLPNGDGTNRYDVTLQLFGDRPLSRDNFLQYVDNDRYDGSFFHRLEYGFVLQGGGYIPASPSMDTNTDFYNVDLDGNASTSNPTVPNEFTNSPARPNIEGTIAYAKVAPEHGGGPDSATNQWFFSLADNSDNLDNQNGGFTVFARVIDGWDLVQAFATQPKDGSSGIPYIPSGGFRYYEQIQQASRTDVLAGDADLDGDVDDDDLAILQDNMGDSFTDALGWQSGDFNADNAVTQADYDLLMTNYTPEPGTLALLGTGAVALLRRRRR